jgi:general secretion pathway protein G
MTRDTHTHHRAHAGFTLVELLIVVAILGILGAMVVPRFSDAARDSRENVLKESLRTLRGQIKLYNAHHDQRPPGYPPGQTTGATEALFKAQMTNPTNGAGEVGTGASYRFGPYLRHVPTNPINNLSTVRVINSGSFPSEPSGTHGWVYQPSTLRFAADSPGTDEQGKRYFDY